MTRVTVSLCSRFNFSMTGLQTICMIWSFSCWTICSPSCCVIFNPKLDLNLRRFLLLCIRLSKLFYVFSSGVRCCTYLCLSLMIIVNRFLSRNPRSCFLTFFVCQFLSIAYGHFVYFVRDVHSQFGAGSDQRSHRGPHQDLFTEEELGISLVRMLIYWTEI